MSMFQKATKRQLKGRLALDGPTGSGKTWTALQWASILGKRTALIDTERGSASLYSHIFDFDVLDMQPPYEPERLIEALKAAESEGYDVVVVDSLSHFWEGEGGVLDIVDGAAQRAQGNSFVGWKVGTPALRHLVDTLLALDAHLIVTMRSKMEYVLELNTRTGKNEPKKIGMAPVMRAGVEYEFAVIGDMDLEHRLTISKSRCDVLADMVFQPGRAAEAAEAFRAWLDDGEPLASRNDIDALKSRMNHLPDDTRTACKKRFVDAFGRPDTLVASSLPAAQAFVAEYETVPPDAGVTEQAAPLPAAIDGDPDRLIDAGQQRQLHIDLGNIAKKLGHLNSKGGGDSKWADLVLDALVLEVTDGRTASTKLLTVAEYGRLVGRVSDLRDEQVKAIVHGPDAVDLVQGHDLLSFARNGDGDLHLTGKVTRPGPSEPDVEGAATR